MYIIISDESSKKQEFTGNLFGIYGGCAITVTTVFRDFINFINERCGPKLGRQKAILLPLEEDSVNFKGQTCRE
jgi:hypothetical protein